MELLVKAKHTLTGNTRRDKSVWRAGDVIRSERDGYRWGAKESKEVWVQEGNDPEDWHGNTFIVKVPGRSKISWPRLLEGEEKTTTIPGPEGLIAVSKIERRRTCHVHMTQVLMQAVTDGVVTLDRQAARVLFVDKTTNAEVPE